MITELKAKYLDIYSTALGKMNGEHPFTYTTQGRSITQELSMLADDRKCHLTSTFMTLKGLSDSKVVSGMRRLTNSYLLSPAAFQHIVTYILKSDNSSQPKSSPAFTFDLTAQELEACKYVGGAIVRSLLKQVHNNSDSEEVVKSWTCQAEGEDWTGLQDRGKLYHVNDQFRDLLVAMDEVSTSVTRDITGNCDLRRTMINSITDSENVVNRFLSIDGGLDKALSDDLFYKLIRCFSKVRCNAFIRNRKRKHDAKSTKKKANPSASFRQSLG